MANLESQTACSICVYCSSSSSVDSVYVEAATRVGELLGSGGFNVIYGGTRIGLMGAMANAARSHGAKVTGIVPEHIRARIADCEDPEALVVTPDMRQRKALMEARADAFLALPGGFGTLEEALEVLTLKQLGQHRKPIVFLNTADFYRPLMTLFQALYDQHFARPEYARLYQVRDTPEEAIQSIRRGLTEEFEAAGTKWD